MPRNGTNVLSPGEEKNILVYTEGVLAGHVRVTGLVKRSYGRDGAEVYDHAVPAGTARRPRT